MGELQPLLKYAEAEPAEELNKKTKQKISETLTDELIIGLCAPIGTNKDVVINEFKKQLGDEERYNYEIEEIKLSTFIKQCTKYTDIEEGGRTLAFTSLMNKIKYGDELRDKFDNSCLAELAITKIHLDRSVENPQDAPHIHKYKPRRICYIIDSLKNKEEVELFRDVYKDNFYCISVFSPENERKSTLNKKGLSPTEITNIINHDYYEKEPYGQNVRDTFIDADFFLRVSTENISDIPKKVERYLHLIFESSIITPNYHEIAMYEAKSAAGNSSCLSRQVGASITNEKGEIISRGWNDVPKYGGNLYKEGETIDKRCKLSGFCSNDKQKDSLTEDIAEKLLTDDDISALLDKFFEDNLEEKSSSKSESNLTFVKSNGKPNLADFKNEIKLRIVDTIRKDSKVKDLIEFSRSVHAEMHAIIIGSQLAGNQMIGGKLYCTTYPCHNCARHIILAGIKEIYYIEPYVKSLGLPLHGDALSDNENDLNKVKLLIYDGVAPRRFLEFFIKKKERKDSNGNVIKIDFPTISPKSRLSLQALPSLEQQAIHSLKKSGLLNIFQDVTKQESK